MVENEKTPTNEEKVEAKQPEEVKPAEDKLVEAKPEEKQAEAKPTEDKKPVEAKPEEKSPEKGNKKGKKVKSKTRKIVEWVLTGILGVFFLFVAIYQVDGMIHRNENYGQSVSFGFATFVIQTDSMEPEYKVGTAIITHKDNADDIYQTYLTELAKVEADSSYEMKIDMTFFDYQRYDAYPTDYATHNSPTSPTNVPMTHRLFEIQVDETKQTGEGRYIFFVAGTNKEGYASAMNQYQNFTEKELLGVVKVNSSFIGGILGFVSSPWGLLVLLLIPALYLVITSVLDIFKAMNDPEEAKAGGKDSTKSANLNKGSLEGLSQKDIDRLKQELLDEMMGKKKDK